jgi:hypothetical protein
MKNKYKNRKTGQIVYTSFRLDETKFEPISVVSNTKMKDKEIIQKGRKKITKK